MQKKEKRPSHPMPSNIIWAVRMLLKYSPLVFAIFAVLVPVNIGLQYLNIYLPALVVAEVTSRQTLQHACFSIGAVLLAMLIGHALNQGLNFIRVSKQGIYRCMLTDVLTRKNLSMFYQTYEKKEVRDLSDRALNAVQMWNGNQPINDILRYSFGILENILGYLLFGTVISFVSPWLVLLLTIAPVVNLVSVRAYNKWEYSHRSETEDLDQKLGYMQWLAGDFSAAKDIRIYGMSAWLRECFHDLSTERGKWDKKTVRFNFLSRIADLLVILIRDGGAYALLIAMFLRGKITVSDFILYFGAISSFAMWVGGMIDCFNRIHRASLQICDFRDYVDYPEQDGSGLAKVEDYFGAAPEIVFDKVCFRYDGAEEDTIHDLSFTLHSGEKLALVGLNGAGKTTIVKLLCRLYTPSSGEIRINGMPLSEFKREDYYKLLSPVFQEVNTAFFSLAETVSGKSLENTDVKKAAECMRRSGLGKKLDELPEGIYTRLNKRVNRNGTELSGGEAQKLMLARALYKDAPLLILDEPTAALDPIAESEIYTEYNQLAGNKSSLFISHRLASTSFCDRILLLKDGSILEEGTHEELVRLGGEYKELFDIQSCWYQDSEREVKEHEIK